MLKEEIKDLIEVAMGKREADLAIINGCLINVYTGEILSDYSVAIKGRRIAYVGKDIANRIGKNTEVIDAKDRYISPGFIDAHNHLASLFQIGEFIKYAAPHGTTAVITETSEWGNIFGLEGVKYFLEDIKNQPIKFFVTTPCMAPPYPQFETSKGFSIKEFEELIKDGRVVGVGESYWPRVLDRDEETLELFSKAIINGKELEGHASGARGDKLTGYVASGISSCHESISEEDALERLRLGLYTMIREGSVRNDLEAISGIKDKGIDLRRLVLCTDGVSPEILMDGNMDLIVKKAIELGFKPVNAIQMVTINPAEHFGLKYLGGIAPNKIADIVILEDLKNIECRYVISNGKLIAKDSVLIVKPKKYSYPKKLYKSIDIPEIKEEDLFIKSDRDRVKVRIVNVVRNFATAERVEELRVVNRNIVADKDKGILKMAIFNRYNKGKNKTIGFLSGVGINRGAIATTLLWDCYNLLVTGFSEKEMAFAANRLIEIGGGFVVTDGGKTIGELPLPIGGIISDEPIKKLAERMDGIKRAFKDLGSDISDPFMLFQTLSFTGLPFVRLTDKGLLDIKNKKFLDIVI
jgi:adenine deaminase